MFLYTLIGFVSIYSVLAVAILVALLYTKHVYGVRGLNNKVNEKFAGKKFVAVFEVYSYVVLAAWVAIALPWLDLFTFGYSTKFSEHGIITYFGQFEGRQADMYFLGMFLNILAVKAAMNLVDLAHILKRGRVIILQPTKMFMLWKPE